MTLSLHGVGASKGVAVGRLHIVNRSHVDVVEYPVAKDQVAAEEKRFTAAIRQARVELAAIRRKIPRETATEIASFIDSHLLMLDDAALTKTPRLHIRERCCNAEWALKIQRDALVSVFESMDDPYLRSRKDDVDHVINRVQRILLNQGHGDDDRNENQFTGKVVFADDLTPADTVSMQNQGVAAFLTEFGGPNSHTAIIARSLRIPAIVGLHDALRYLRDDVMVAIDGRYGVVLVDPRPSEIREYEQRQRKIERIRIARKILRDEPAVSIDGVKIQLQANVELGSDLRSVNQVGAAGVGLYRTEYLFMNRDEPPGEEEQLKTYARLIKSVKGGPVTVRTLDLGADKQVDGARPGAPMSSNPALGLRGVRLCLKEQSLFRPQIRAILRASAQGPVRIMVPMISTISEWHQVLKIIAECRAQLRVEKRAFAENIPVGAMIEVPAAAVCADLFAREMDFMSIGTNDLIQYTIAIDRSDDEVTYLYDPLHPAVLRLVQSTIKAGKRAGIPVAMCGEMAGDGRFTKLLLGLGLTEFSVHPNALLEIKHAITTCDVKVARGLANRFMRSTREDTRARLVREINGIDTTNVG